jgi:hypothetical protein
VKGMTSLLWKSARQLVPKGQIPLAAHTACGHCRRNTRHRALGCKALYRPGCLRLSLPVSEIVISVILFALLFATTRIANYLQKTYRVKFFDKAFGADESEKSKFTESWEWAMALEMVNVFSS